MNAAVHYVVISYNTSALLENLLRYFQSAAPGHRFRVTVVDNASADGSADLAGRFPGVSVIRLPENLGYAAAVNAAFRENESPYFCVLNTDVILNDQALRECHRFLETHGEAAAVSPLVLWPDGRLQNFWFQLRIPVLCSEYLRKLFTISMRRRLTRPGAPPARLDGLKGAFLFLRAFAFAREREIFDEDYFFYFEDTDLAFRMKQRKMPCFALPGASIVHIGAQSPLPVKSELFYLNKYRCYEKRLSGFWRWYVRVHESTRIRRKAFLYGVVGLFWKRERVRAKRAGYLLELKYYKSRGKATAGV